MAKRRADESDSEIDVSSTDSENEELEEGVEDNVDVDFDYFDLNPTVDFHATKNFIRQLFGDDANYFDISQLADLILQDGCIGTTIKTDGQESDPFALLSVINMTQHHSNKAVKTINDYLLRKTAKQTAFNLSLRKLLLPQSKFKVGLIVSERLINMPVEVVPPMYKLLSSELQAAEEAHNEEYAFDHFVVVSKVYEMVKSTMDDDDAPKKKKKVAENAAPEMDYYHYEDMVLELHALFKGTFAYDKAGEVMTPDARRVFNDYGIDPKLSIMLLKKSELEKCVPEMEEKFPPF
ncbi:hypothetical protein BABINDRAFT_162870 [Babjeviella inositovora NRRL Y-12698]|uniref:Protein BCP1 n=1 Tax=Babjeviella inositovora NRRL Y-12698 TaxID=984486 RepID=A0A1E3QKJ1_9ASCO|nr:uncharacterized protein BABINDRAFT_162870 [Babjeviella inositovora NRRL Y-12698]ODQ78203.1 hypothetical protein BABINDRAFT_162870 [Babjeviella inositovora NRRL Y-12698]